MSRDEKSDESKESKFECPPTYEVSFFIIKITVILLNQYLLILHFQGTIVVRKPLGLRIHKSSLRVTFVEPNAAALGEAFIGDKVVAIDERTVNDINVLYKMLKEPTPIVAVRFEHGTFSYCKHLGTTVEMIQLDKEVTKATGRAIDVIKVALCFKSIHEFEDQKIDLLQMSVQYDARERVQIVSCEPGGLASVHLRPGDIVRDVNEHPIASKEMLQYYILDGITEQGQVRFTIERAAGGDDAYRDQIEMSQDVIEIAQKQIQAFKKTKQNVKSVLHDPKKPIQKNVKIDSGNHTEVLIQSDHDPSTLKSCKNANK